MPNSPSVGLANLLACTHLDRLDIEICSLEDHVEDTEGLKKRSIDEAITLEDVIRQLREKSGTALRGVFRDSFVLQVKENITWMMDRQSEELTGIVASGKETGSQNVMHLLWTIWMKGIGFG